MIICVLLPTILTFRARVRIRVRVIENLEIEVLRDFLHKVFPNSDTALWMPIGVRCTLSGGRRMLTFSQARGICAQ